MGEDRLTPIITLVIYWGDGDFDAPTCLHEMFEPTDERILQYADNYKINLINPNCMEKEDFKKFHTEFGFVLNIIKNKNNAARLKETIESEWNQKIGIDTVMLLNSLLKWNIPVDESEEEMDMCKGMEDLLSQATEQGRKEGREEGRAYMRGMMDEVRQEGRTEGRTEGRCFDWNIKNTWENLQIWNQKLLRKCNRDLKRRLLTGTLSLIVIGCTAQSLFITIKNIQCSRPLKPSFRGFR